jgi:hypothetical protein
VCVGKGGQLEDFGRSLLCGIAGKGLQSRQKSANLIEGDSLAAVGYVSPETVKQWYLHPSLFVHELTARCIETTGISRGSVPPGLDGSAKNAAVRY